MTKGDKPDGAPKQTEAERDALIDAHYRDRIVGGNDEGAAWAAAFGGPGAPGASAENSAPLSADEKAAVRDLMIHAAEQGDTEALDRLQQLADNPVALRQVMAGFDPGP